ncbi:MAG: imidazole glycerol phosphate synthase subunit HisH [Candidatus Omnitrophica bacterium]|nr:imidazole glycerol phosphate synthase subunit HisH [Candidatus Omnitrophota bacterium]
MDKFIAVVDYGLGNLRSVSKALEAVGAETRVTNDPQELKDSAAIVLPGVGAFQRAMENLQALDIMPTICRQIEKGKPFLGICLGLQILFTESQEHGRNAGLDIIKGKVTKFPAEVKIPHMGWNNVNLKFEMQNAKLFKDIPDGSYFYFVHSYYVEPKDKKTVVASTEYGKVFTSVINKDNLWGVQFHPEKSHKLGLKVLEGFLSLC